MKLLFHRSAPQKELRNPRPALIPDLEYSSIAAHYRAARVGGDFFDFSLAPSGRLLFLLADIAGRRDQALDIAAAMQSTFHEDIQKRFASPDANDNEELTHLLIELNRALLKAAGGVRAAPAFLGCYDERFGTLVYINAGHPPALLRDSHGITRLEPNGFPMGLFSHATHDAQLTVLAPGAALVVASKGLLEVRSRRKEFGFERLEAALAGTTVKDATSLCGAVLTAVEAFLQKPSRKESEPISENDATVLAVVRHAAAAAARA